MHDPSLQGPNDFLLLDLLEPAHYATSAAAIPYALAAAACAFASLLTWIRDPDTRATRLHTALAGVLVLWCIGRALLRMAIDPAGALAVSRVLYVLIPLAVPLLFEFHCVLTRNGHRTLLIRTQWVVGITLGFLSLTSPWLVAGLRQMPWGAEPAAGPLGWALAAWIGILLAVAARDLRRSWHRSLPGSGERARLKLLAVATLLLQPATSDVLVAVGLPWYPLTSLAIPAYVVLTAWMLLRHGLVEVGAELAADRLAELIPHALLILDADGAIRAANTRACHLLGLRRERVVGQSASALLGRTFAPEQIRRLARDDVGDLEKEFILHPHDGSPPRDVAASFASLRGRNGQAVAFLALIRDVTAERRREQQRIHQGLHDPLTGLPNRAMLIGLLDAAVRQAQAPGSPGFVCCVVAADRLRIINEDLGHSAGDQLLVTTARRLHTLLHPTETVARIGGDEFALLLEPGVEPAALELRLQAVLDALSQPVELEGHAVYPSFSIGVAGSETRFSGGADALRIASAAMFRAKEQGGGRIARAHATEVGRQRTRLEAELRRAIDRREFVVHYQPVVDVQARRICAIEALVRWRHPERGIISPAAFIEYAEETGLVAQIDRQVMEIALSDLARLRAEQDHDIVLSLNMAEQELRGPDFPDRVAREIDGHGLPRSALRLELLERVALTAEIRSVLIALHRHGIELCIDDFGTGYSSLSRLHELPIRVLKIDRSFVRAMGRGEGGDKLISSILALAGNLGMATVAEGAGSEEEARALVALGCREIQGFYFAQPMPPEALQELLADPSPVIERIDRIRSAG